MFLRDPRDFHFIAICLTHELASPASLAEAVSELENNPLLTLGDVLLKKGILTENQHKLILDAIVENQWLARAIEADEPMVEGVATHTQKLEYDREPTLLLSGLTPSGEPGTTLTLPRKPETPPVTSSTGSLDPIDDAVISPGTGLGSYSGSGGSMAPGGTGSMGKSFSAAIRSRTRAEELVGTEIAGHIIEGIFGRGAHGQVFKARQRSLGRIVALKILPPDIASREDTIGRFISEARTLATFTHPNIVQVYDVGSEDGVYFFTMEAVPGQTLKDLLKSQGRVPVPVGVNMMKQCLRGLERASRAGVIHRDIKPGNLMIDDAGEVKLADFGISERVSESGVVESTAIVGTPLYISPEQARGKDVTTSTDQYSLGATFYHLLTGEPPFVGASVGEIVQKHITDPVPDPCAQAPEIPSELGQILQRMMSKEPAERFDSFQELFKVLEEFELRQGLIESRSTFLSEGLMNIGERSVRGLRAKVLLGASIGVVSTLAAVGISITLDRTGLGAWKKPIGNIGATLLIAGFAAIMYIAGVRKGLLPKFGNIRIWLQTHIALALTGYLLSMVHSGNFLRFFAGPQTTVVPGHGTAVKVVPIIPFLNSFLFTAVVISGIVGRYIWRDIANQIATERIQRGEEARDESHELTLSIFAQRSLRHWRIFHYPMAFALIVVTLVHIISIYYYGGNR